MLYVERLYLKGRLGKGVVAVRRLQAAKRLVSDYEFSGFVASIPCGLSLGTRGTSNREATADKVCAADRYIEATRACGPLFYPVIRHFVLDDLSLTDWAAVNVLPNNGRTAQEACARLCLALDRVGEAYHHLNEREKIDD